MWDWKRELLDREVEVVKELEIKVGIFRLDEEMKDRWTRVGGKEIMYTTKEGYRELTKKEDINPMRRWAKLVWNKWIPSKVCAFVWKLIQDKVPLKVNLKKRGIYLSDENLCCKRCEGIMEIHGTYLVVVPLQRWYGYLYISG